MIEKTMKSQEKALQINEYVINNPRLLVLLNSNERLTLIAALMGWEFSKKDRKRLRKIEKKIKRFNKTMELDKNKAIEIFDIITNAKNKRAMKYYSDKYSVSIAALVIRMGDLPERIENESTFMYHSVKFPDGSSISKSEYERITQKKHYHRSYDNEKEEKIMVG